MARKDFSQTVVLELQYQQYQINENLFLLSKKCNIINKGRERKFFNTLYFFSIFDYQKLFSQLLPPKNGKFWKYSNSQNKGVVTTQFFDSQIRGWYLHSFLIHKSGGGTHIPNIVGGFPKLPTAGIRISIRLWDVKTGQEKAKQDGHSYQVYSVKISPDGTTLQSGSSDNSISLWDVKTSKEILQSDNSYKSLLAQFKTPLQNSSLLANVNPYCTILRICQNPQLEASGTLLLQGQFINHQGKDLKPLFKSKGCCFLEDLKQK